MPTGERSIADRWTFNRWQVSISSLTGEHFSLIPCVPSSTTLHHERRLKDESRTTNWYSISLNPWRVFSKNSCIRTRAKEEYQDCVFLWTRRLEAARQSQIRKLRFHLPLRSPFTIFAKNTSPYRGWWGRHSAALAFAFGSCKSPIKDHKRSKVYCSRVMRGLYFMYNCGRVFGDTSRTYV